MSEQELRESAEAVAAELIVVAGAPDLVEVRAAVVHSVISDRMLPADPGATVREALEHAGIILSIVTMTLGKALDELHVLDPDDTAGGRDG